MIDDSGYTELLDELQAEIAALKAALETIRDEAIDAAFNAENNVAFTPEHATLLFDELADIARRALESGHMDKE